MILAIEVTDTRSSTNDQIALAAKIIGGSKIRLEIFNAIYTGKKKVKSISEIQKKINFPRKRILEEAIKFVHTHIVRPTKLGAETAYEQDKFFLHHKRKIISLATNKTKLEQFPTKTHPISNIIKIQNQANIIKTQQIYIDDISSFSKVKKIKKIKATPPLYEVKFKHGVQKIIKEKGIFKDWGGERNDLYSTRINLKGKRVSTAFAFKGRATKGKLIPKMMGKNGDQIQRLFGSPAELFIIQYWGNIDESIIEQMKIFAIAKSIMERKKIYYGIIDGEDTARLISAYPQYFK